MAFDGRDRSFKLNDRYLYSDGGDTEELED